MRRRFIVLLAGMVAASSSFAFADMTLSQAIARALAHDPGIPKVHADVTDALGFMVKTRADLLPQISIEGRAGAALRERQFQNEGEGDMLFSRRASIIGRQNIWDWCATHLRVQDAKFRVLAKQELDKAQRETTAINAVDAFLGVIRARKQLELARESTEAHGKVAELSKKRAEAAGNQADIELSTARYELARTLVLERQLSLRQAEAAFERWVGVKPPAGLRMPATPQISSMREIDPRRNFHYLATLKQHSAAEMQKKSIERKFGPRFFLEATAGVGQDVAGTRGYDRDASVMLVGSFDIFDGQRKKGELIQAMADIDRQLAIIEETLVLLKEDITSRWEDYRTIGKRMAVLQDYAGGLDKTVTLYEQQFNLGTRPLLSLLDIQNEKISASVRLTDAERDRTFLGYRLLFFGGCLIRETLGERYLEARQPAPPMQPESRERPPAIRRPAAVMQAGAAPESNPENQGLRNLFRKNQELRTVVAN